MRYRRYRPLEELYGATERIPEAEITPVLQGVYRIQGPIDECDDELQSVNLGNFSVDERPESSACNVCSAPCSSCLHANQSLPFMESKIECDPSGSTSGRKEEDSCSSNGASEAVDKSKASDDNQHACAETSNLLSSTSSLDFCPENTFMEAASKEPVPCDPERSTKNEGSSLAGKVEAVTVGRQNCTASPMNEVNEADNKNPSLVSSENCDAYLGTENAKDNNVLSDEVNNCGFSDEQCEKDPNLAEDCKMEVLDVRQKTISESENSEEIEDDVKVCDICGDAGQEELLAFCSRCTDGAEHIYCMRIMLDEVPEGDWLCEECQLKEEAQKQNLDSEAPSLGAKDEEIGTSIDPKFLHNETKEPDPDSKGSSKVLQSADISTKRNEDNIEVPSLSRQCSPRKGTTPFNDSSFSNLDAGKAKQESAQHLGQALTSSASNLPRIHPPQARGSLSKSISFNNSKVAKVKQLIDDVPPKQKNAKEPASNSTRKEGLNKTITKYASFKTTNNESLNKTKPLNPLWAEELRSVKEVKERILTSKKSTSLQQPSAIPSHRAGLITPPPKADSEIVQHDTKGNNISKSSNIGNSRGSDNANTIGSNEMHKTNLLKASGVALSNGLSKPSDQKTGQLVSKDKFFTSGPMDKPLGSNRASRCQKCNEAGHITQFCAVDKLRMSALKPLADRTLSLKERSGKGIKTKDLMEVASLKPRTQVSMKTPKSPDRNAKVSTLNVDQNSESTRNLVESKEKLEVLSNQASVLTNQLRASVIPELEYIWLGDFELLRIARPSELCDGIQAHASSCVSPKALEAVTHFKSKIQLEEVPRRSSWPRQFQENGPREDNIAVFFFAKDIESYEKNYSKLVDSLVKNDFSLKGRIDTVELLIYPSNLLPENSQRWNNLFFLWGVFRSWRENCLEKRPDLQLMPCESDLNKDLMDIDLPTASLSSSGVPASQDLSNCEKVLAEVDIANIPSSEIVHTMCDQKSTSPQAAVGDKEVTRTHDKSEEDQFSFSFPESGLLKNTSEHPNVPASNNQINPDMQSRVKNDSWQNDISYNANGENDIGNALHVHGHVQMDSKDRKLSNYEVPSISNLGEGSENITEDKIGQGSLKRSEVFPDDHLEDPMDIDLPSGSLRALRKRNSSALEIFSHSPCVDLKDNGKMMHWEEEANFVSYEGQREHKKVKLDLNPNPGGDILDGKFSSKVHPLSSSSLVDNNNNIDNVRIPESSINAGRYFFPVDLDIGPPRTAKQEPIDILSSSDDEDARERGAPDLELALWDAKKSPKKDASSFPSKIAEKRKQDRPPSLAAEVEDGNDPTASLSLSLGFPVSEKAQAATTKATAKSENLLPDKAVIGSSFFLFNSLRDT